MDSLGGVFVDAKGEVVALWSSYSFPADRNQQAAEEFFGLPTQTVAPVVRSLCAGEPVPAVWSLVRGLSHTFRCFLLSFGAHFLRF